MHVIVTCKNEEDPMKNEGARVATTFRPLLVNWNFSRRSIVQGRTWPKFEYIRDFMVVLATCKNEEDPIGMNALL